MELLNALDLGDNLIEELAREVEFYKIKPKKITATNLIQAFLEIIDDTTISFNKIAMKVHELTGDGPSKQAISKRVNEDFVELLKKLLQAILAKSSENSIPFFKMARYARVIIQDSTIIRLPIRLYELFSGVSNGSSVVCNARLQYAVDIKTMELIHFSIDTYSENDSVKAHELIFGQNDLVLRDRGYFFIKELERQIEADVDFILRHKANAIYRSIETNKQINLLKKLKKNRTVDQYFYLNNENKTKVRVVARPVPKEVSDQRKAKAIKESSSKYNLLPETLKLMEWDIYVTNISDMDFETIKTLYRVRWWVEIIFKTLKSNFNLDDVHNVSKIHLYAIIYSRLIVSVVAQKFIYASYSYTLKDDYTVSMVKLFGMIKMNYKNLIEHVKNAAVASLEQPCKNLTMIIKYCCYAKRKRENFIDMLHQLEDNLNQTGS